MNKIIRNVFIFIVILVFILGFSPSYTSLNIDNLAYVIAIGIDIGENEDFKISFQFTTGTSSTESGSSEKSPLIINSVEASSIDSAISLMNSYMARELNLSHCRLVIFSEDVAFRGISNEIYTLMNNSEMRPSANVIVSKNKAKYYMENTTPILENLITKYYEIFPNSSKYTGYVYNVDLGEFFNQLINNTCEPFAILGGVNSNSSDSSTSSNFTNVDDIKSTDTSISAKRGSENIGVAVFKEDKLVGELSAEETLCLSIVRGEVESFTISIPNPQKEEKKIDLILYPEDGKKIKVHLVNGAPYITFNRKFTGKIYSMSNNSKYLDSSVLENISAEASRYLEEIITNYLYRTSVEFKSDINGFGKYCLSNFLTLPEFEAYGWQNNYTNASFKVSIDTDIESGFLITQT